MFILPSVGQNKTSTVVCYEIIDSWNWSTCIIHKQWSNYK